MKVLKIGVLLAFAAALSSCEIPFALDDVSEPVIYVQYIPAGGSDAPGMRIAYADPAFGKDDGKRYSLSAGDVLISVNGKAMPLDDSQIESDGNMFTLRPGCRFAPGDKVRVEVKGHGVKDVHAETTVPQMPEIASVGQYARRIPAFALHDDVVYARVAARQDDLVILNGVVP